VASTLGSSTVDDAETTVPVDEVGADEAAVDDELPPPPHPERRRQSTVP
jgi:hypothetical protein